MRECRRQAFNLDVFDVLRQREHRHRISHLSVSYIDGNDRHLFAVDHDARRHHQLGADRSHLVGSIRSSLGAVALGSRIRGGRGGGGGAPPRGPPHPTRPRHGPRPGAAPSAAAPSPSAAASSGATSCAAALAASKPTSAKPPSVTV